MNNVKKKVKKRSIKRRKITKNNKIINKMLFLPIIIILIILTLIYIKFVRKDMFELNVENKKNYIIKSSKEVKEQDINIVELEHKKTKAKVLLFMCEDENRVFNIAFKTPASDSKGKPHILEHSVLCGSRKYDVKDPFVELAKSSLNTFLNAITYDDKTCYPVASANIKDFHNLVDVYLDAVFYPNVLKDERLFRQEGWHYEISDKNAPLTVNGVVYNEMRGVFSDPDSLLEYSIAESLFPDTNYKYVSGGKPIDIIDLSYEEFVDFHNKYYSASNSIIYYYGKLDYNEELKYLNDEYLSKQDYIDVDAKIYGVKDYVKDNEKISEYNLEKIDSEDKSYMAYSFALGTEKSSLKGIALEVLDYILFSSDGAIIREKCQEEGLGEEISTMYYQGLYEGTYSIITKNINKNKKDKFVSIILDSINEIIENGFDENKVKAALNTLYFSYAEDEFGSTPKGLALILASLDSYLYGDSYDTFLSYKKAFDTLNAVDLKDKNNYFIKLLKELFIDNNHRCINILNPSSTFVYEKEENLKKKFENIKANMSDDEISNEIKKCSELKEFQKIEDTEEKLKSIPKLDVSDIERDKKFINYNKDTIDGIDVISSTDNEKDIVYLQLYYDVTDYSKEELYMLSVLSHLILKTNLENEDYHSFNEYIDINTGGLYPKINVTEDKVFFGYEIKATEKNVDKAYEILNKAIKYVTFNDKERINILINELKTKAFTTMLYNGHSASVQRANSIYSFAANIIDKVDVGSVGFNQFISALSKVYYDNSDDINNLMINIYKKTLQKKLTFCYCANEKYDKQVRKLFIDFIKNINNYNAEVNVDEISENIKNGIANTDKYMNYDKFDKKVKKEAIITPNEINFCGLAGKFEKENYNGRLKFLKVLFNYEYLWTNLRVLGGAYGCSYTAYRDGSYVFASYRDPNLSNTNKVYLNVNDYLKNFDKSDDEIKKYIIGTMGTIDNPLTTVGKFRRNVSSYFNNIDDEFINEERHSILDSKTTDIKDMYKIFDNIDEEHSMCALISANKVEEARKEYDAVWNIME